MITVIGRPIGNKIPNAIPVAIVIKMRSLSKFKEPRRIGGGEIGSEPIEFRGISHNITEKDRQDSYYLCSFYWEVRHYNDIYFESNNKRLEILFSSYFESQNWKRKNMVGYYKRDLFGNIFIDWDVVCAEKDIVVGRKLY